MRARARLRGRSGAPEHGGSSTAGGPLSHLIGPQDPERGSAILEFLALTLVVLLPVVLGIAALSLVQRGSYAVSGAARDAARVYATAPDVGTGEARARAAAGVVFADYDLAQRGSVTLTCSGTCLAPGTTVRAEATVSVPIPGLASVFGRNAMTTITLTSSQVSPVDEFKAAP